METTKLHIKKSINLLKLVSLLSSKTYKTSSELAEELGVSQRTVKRYLADLQTIPGLVSITSSKEGYKVMEMPSPKTEGIRPEVLMMKGFIKGEGSEDLSQLPEIESRIRDSLLIDKKSVITKKEIDILNACIQRRVIEITHQKAQTGEMTRRIVQPLALYLQDGKWYLIGYCEMKKELRKFRTVNIKDVRITEKKFDPFFMPESVKIKEFLSHSLIMPVPSKKPKKVEIKVNKWFGEYLQKTPLTPSQKLLKLDDGYKLVLKLTDYEALVPWILQFYNECEILSPPSLKKLTINWAKEVIKKMR